MAIWQESFESACFLWYGNYGVLFFALSLELMSPSWKRNKVKWKRLTLTQFYQRNLKPTLIFSMLSLFVLWAPVCSRSRPLIFYTCALCTSWHWGRKMHYGFGAHLWRSCVLLACSVVLRGTFLIWLDSQVKEFSHWSECVRRFPGLVSEPEGAVCPLALSCSDSKCLLEFHIAWGG